MRVLTAQEMREIDRRAIEELGVPSLVLMENAAVGVVDAIGHQFRHIRGATVYCGPGNNGGDGLAIARHLASRGYDVTARVVNSGELRGDAAEQATIAEALGLRVERLTPDEAVRVAATTAHELVVDALFGTGLNRPLEGAFAELVARLSHVGCTRVAVDLPSGLMAGDHRVLGPSLVADLTVAFFCPKVAHLLEPARERVGELVVADLGIPSEVFPEIGVVEWLTEEQLSSVWRPRARTAHKGDCGHLLVVGGSTGKSGATALAALGALRMGTGLVTVACPEGLVPTLETLLVEAMTEGWPPQAPGETVETLLAHARGRDAVVVGPGLGVESETVELVRGVVSQLEQPCVVDADGLNAFRRDAAALRASPAQAVLTPHAGELARLLGVERSTVEEDRLAAVRKGAATTGKVTVLKGAETLVASPEGRVWINSTGNSGMATGGTGDVLSGVVGALLAAGYDPADAACLGVFLHGAAGDEAAGQKGPIGLIAGDVVEALPAVTRAWEASR